MNGSVAGSSSRGRRGSDTGAAPRTRAASVVALAWVLIAGACDGTIGPAATPWPGAPDGGSQEAGAPPTAPGAATDALADALLPDAGEPADGSADAGGLPSHEWPSVMEESGLPVLRLVPAAPLLSDRYTSALVMSRGHAYTAQAKLRGSSSLEYPKPNYTLKFAGQDRFNEPVGGFTANRKVVLFSSFDDTSHLRTRLAFELWNRLQGGALHVRATSVVLYLGDEYAGLYTMVDHIDEDFFAAAGHGVDGQLFKGVTHEASFFFTEGLAAAFEKKAGLPEAGLPGAFDAIEELAWFITQSDDEEFGSTVGEIVDLESYGSWFILASAIFANDSFGKNAYNHLGDDGVWRAIPWDFNASFGQDWATFRMPSDQPWNVARPYNRLFQRACADPGIGPALQARFAEALRSELAVHDILALIDGWAAELRPAALRDAERWQSTQRTFPRWAERNDFSDFDAEVAFIKEWIEARWAGLAAALLPPPVTPAPAGPAPEAL